MVTLSAILTGDVKRPGAGFAGGGNEGTHGHRDTPPAGGGTQPTPIQLAIPESGASGP